ncbi:MAG: hypothetical protein WBC63_05935 [Candidatus Bipolaricaulia bacterium]
MALSSVLAVCAPARAAYDRLAACQYARDYWNTVCSDGYYFADSEGPTLFGAGEPLPTGEEGFDCAHFVSCCIGGEPNRPAGGLDVPSRTLAYGEPGAQRLVDWLLDQGATPVDRISTMVPGDVVAYDTDRNVWIEHVALYMGDGLVTAHSLSRYSEWNPHPEADIILLHLPGAYEPPRVERAPGWIGWTVVVIALAGLAAAIFAFSRR